MTPTRLLLVGLLLGGCSGPAPEIRIGLLASYTGERRETSGRGTVEAARLAERRINEAGGLAVGRKRFRVVVIMRDIGDQADRATSEARELLNRDSVVALVGPQFSRDAIPVAGLAEQARVPMITPMATHPRATQDKRYVFRIAYVDDLQGSAMARFGRETLRAGRAALLYDIALDYSRNLAEVFRKSFESLGGTVVADEHFTSDQATDFTDQLRRIAAARPDVIYAPNFISADSIQMVQARRLGLTATFLGSDSWDPVAFGNLPEANGVFYTSQWHSGIGTEVADSFIARYTREYGRAPLATAAATWDAFQLIFSAIQAVGSTEPDSIRRGIAAMTEFPGVTGVLSYRNGGDPRKSAYIMRIDHGQGVFARRVDP